MTVTLRAGLFLTALLPLSAANLLLEANRGQFRSDVYFQIRSGPVSAAVTNSGMQFSGYGKRVALRLEDVRPHECLPASGVAGTANYLAANPPIARVPRYERITCRDVYPGIDWTVHTTDATLEHDWNLAPGADASAIVLILNEEASATLTDGGDLLFRSGDLSITWKVPKGYQDIKGTRSSVPVRYVLNGQRITLQVGSYRHDLPLVLDPAIDFSYVVNGNGDDRGCQVALDGAGNIYIAGLTLSSDFQTTPGAAFGAPQTLDGSYYQVFVNKLSPDGSTLIYSTYLGVSAFVAPTHPLGMRVDSAGNIYLAANVFLSAPLPGEGTPINSDGVVGVYKLAPSGDQLLYGNRVIPDYSYDEQIALAVDSSGNAYAGIGSGIVTVSKIDPTGTIQLLTFQVNTYDVGGPGLADLGLGPDGSIYLAGTTSGGSFVTTPGAFMQTAANLQNSHGYVVRMKPDGSAPIYSTYIAGQYSDYLSALVVDATGAAYVGGQTSSDSASPGLAGTLLGSNLAQPNRGFVLKLDPTGSTALYSALLPNTWVEAVAVDATGNAYAGGPNAIGELTLSKIAATGPQLVYYSSIPAPVAAGNPATGMAVDSSGAAYLTGSIATLNTQDLIQTGYLLPNAFLLKMDPTPVQCDLSLQAQPVSPFIPGELIDFTFTIQNNGPSAAADVVFTATPQGGVEFSCRVSGNGVCGSNPYSPWASFASIAPGVSQTVELIVSSNYSPVSNAALGAGLFSLTSDVNQNNNSTSVTAPEQYVEYNIDPQGGVCVVSGAFELPNYVNEHNCTVYAAPGSQFQVYWPSPQQTVTVESAVFQSWSDGSTDNPRTFTATPAARLYQ